MSSDLPTSSARLRIGELSRRTGVGADTLRAWERRYGLLHPERSPGGFRLYAAADETRVRAMTALLAEGLSAGEAARSLREPAPARAVAAATTVAPQALELADALAALDDGRANAMLDRAVAALSLDALLADVLLATMREIGERWERGEIGIGEEHFASNLVRGRMVALARGWGTGAGALAVLACPPGEHHDLGLIAFGLALRARGWRIAYLGQDTPIQTAAETAERLGARLIVVAALDPEALRPHVAELRGLAGLAALRLGGPGAAAPLAQDLGTAPLPADPVAAAQQVAADLGTVAP
jgi:MerR family transcriptional regulator, light-induced transcriptional regulator